MISSSHDNFSFNLISSAIGLERPQDKHYLPVFDRKDNP